MDARRQQATDGTKGYNWYALCPLTGQRCTSGGSGFFGLAWLGGKVADGTNNQGTGVGTVMAQELAHQFGLLHTSITGAGDDPNCCPNGGISQNPLDPGIVIPLALSAVLYARGWRCTPHRDLSRRQALSFSFGWLILVVALVSPAHAMGEALFSAHMVQHELLMMAAAPLIVMGRPLVTFLWALPPGWRPRVGRAARMQWARSPLLAWMIHLVTLWAWHAPVLFEATLRSDLIHSLQHISFLGSALIFWWALLETGARGISVLYIFTTAAHTSVLGALLTFSQTVWYPAYAASTPAWGFTPLEDQQIGGLIMWIPAGVVYIIAGLWVFAAWLRESEWKVLQHEGTHDL